MKYIELTQGKQTKVDDEDYGALSQFKWRVMNGYAARYSPYANGKRTLIHMHRFIANTPKGLHTDHIDGNTLNNQRSNLRICTNAQNQCNRRIRKDNTTGYKGVSKLGKRWEARIRHNKKLIHLGTFDSKKLAALAYNLAAQHFHGEFAKINNVQFPQCVHLQVRREGRD